MMRIAKNEYVLGRYMSYEELVSDLEKVTVEEVVQMANQAFKEDGVSMVTLGPIKEEDIDPGCLQFAGN